MIRQSMEVMGTCRRRGLAGRGPGRTGPATVAALACLVLGLAGLRGAAQPPAQLPDTVVPAQGKEPAPGVGNGAGARQGTEVMPVPRAASPFGPNQVRLPRMLGPAGVGTTPQPTPEVSAEFRRFVKDITTPENTFEVIQGRTHLLTLEGPPKRIQIADESVAAYTIITPTEISMLGRNVGITNLNLWFNDPAAPGGQRVLSYLVRVLPDPEMKERLERVYKELETEVNRAFKDSRVSLMLVGDKLLVCGQAKDIAEANYILQIVRANAPAGGRETIGERTARVPVDRQQLLAPVLPGPDGLLPQATDSYQVSGGPIVVNLLKVVGEQQVMLQVRVAEVNRAAARSIGLNFAVFNNQGLRVAGSTVGQINPVNGIGGGGFFAPFQATGLGRGINSFQTLNRSGGVLNNLPVALDNGQIQLAINALRELNYARTLAEPTLVTMNGQTANFQAGGLFPVPYVTGFTGAGLQGVNFIPVGVQLNFTPFVTDKDRIRLNVSAEVSERDLTLGATIINGSAVPSLTTRNFQTTVELREGQTLAVAGLIQNRLGANSARVPGVGDLPIVGRLFSFDRIHNEEQELVILITPELVHPLEPKQIGPLPGCDLFEPDDIEFYLLGRIEGRRAVDYRSAVMTDVHRMCRFRKCEQLYIVGPHGHSCADEIGEMPLPDAAPAPPAPPQP